MLHLPYTNERYKDKPVKRSWRIKSPRTKSIANKGGLMIMVSCLIFVLRYFWASKDGGYIHDNHMEDDLFVDKRWHSSSLAKTLADARQANIRTGSQNVFVLLNGLTTSDTNLVALGCEMSLQQSFTRVHFIILGMGSTTIEEYRTMNQFGDDCTAYFHDARITSQNLQDDGKKSSMLASYAANAITLIVDAHAPQAILYTHSRTIPKPNWFTAALQPQKDRATIIQFSQSSLPSLEWLASLSAKALNAWNKPRIDILIDPGSAAGSVQRLLQSLTAAHYVNDERPLLLLNYNATLAGESMYDFANSQSHQWPRDRLILKSVTGNTEESIFDAWYPLNPDHYLLLLKGTDEVSPWFWHYLLMTLLKYRYVEFQMRMEKVYGITLQSSKKRTDGRDVVGDLNVPTVLFPSHFIATHQIIRESSGITSHVSIWEEYLVKEGLVVISPPDIVHQDGTFVFVKTHHEEEIDLSTPITTSHEHLLKDPEWWKTIGPDQLVSP